MKLPKELQEIADIQSQKSKVKRFLGIWCMHKYEVIDKKIISQYILGRGEWVECGTIYSLRCMGCGKMTCFKAEI